MEFVAYGSGSSAGSVRQAEFLAVRFPESGVGVGRFFFAEVMELAGFRRVAGRSVIFRHEAKDLVGVVHGDDFVSGRSDEDLKVGGESSGG